MQAHVIVPSSASGRVYFLRYVTNMACVMKEYRQNFRQWPMHNIIETGVEVVKL
jgi:hypothetical protein